MPEVLVHQTQGYRLQGFRGRGDLREYIDAVLVVLNHPLQATDLPLDTPQALDERILLSAVSPHADLLARAVTARIPPTSIYSEQLEVIDELRYTLGGYGNTKGVVVMPDVNAKRTYPCRALLLVKDGAP
jgi:hypothetical protein